MRKIALALAAFLIFLSPASAQEKGAIPQNMKDQMKRMVGSWKFTGKDGERLFAGAEKIRLTNGGTAIVQEGYFNLGGEKKEHYVILSGWDGRQKTIHVRAFTSQGYTWTGQWKKLTDGKWEGTADGGSATLEVNNDSMRYEDTSKSAPWISNFTRVPAEKE